MTSQEVQIDFLKAEVERLTQELTRIIGSVQRLQPAGSPPPGGPEILVKWIIATQQSALAAMTAERDRLAEILSENGATGLVWMTRDEMRESQAAAERLAQIEAMREDLGSQYANPEAFAAAVLKLLALLQPVRGAGDTKETT